MRVFACKDLDGYCSVIQSELEPVNPNNFNSNAAKWGYLTMGDFAKSYCNTLAPGTFRELKRLDVVSGEFEFVEEVKVKGLREAWKDYKSVNMRACDHELNDLYAPLWRSLAAAIDRELSKPAPRYDEKLIDELLEVGARATASLPWLLKDGESWTDTSNRRAAEILQELKRAKGEGAE